ncbi:MAG: hypothetical protein KGM17_11880 [Sphingomonadales bacterium]|nr:hypothetical protein [Sphingomonadales bacterium]
MKHVLVLPLAALALVATPQLAQAKGCVRGAIAGGVAGHFVGRHHLMGAAAGCLIARHHYKVKAREEASHRPAPHR